MKMNRKEYQKNYQRKYQGMHKALRSTIVRQEEEIFILEKKVRFLEMKNKELVLLAGLEPRATRPVVRSAM
jgi:hypothetical protein